MLTLHLSGRPAYLPPTTTIKLTRCNPYFENQGDYTLELQLPLQGCPQNQAIFGPLHRPEQPHTPALSRHIPMQLIAPPIHLTGYALITAITPTQVKLQLVAGRSALNHAIEDDATYIDHLDLGRCWDTFSTIDYLTYDEENHAEEHLQSGQSIEDQRTIFQQPDHITTSPHIDIVATMMHGTPAQTDSVCLPIYSQTDDQLCNTPASPLQAQSPLHLSPTTILAPQPYLVGALRRVLTAAGYPNPDLRYLEESPLISHLIIATARQDITLAHHLPHWTLSTFLSELQNLLAIVFTVTDDGRVHAIPRSTYYTRTRPIQPIHTDHPTRQAELDQSQDAQNLTTTAGSVDYDYPTDPSPILHLPDEVFERAQILTLPSLSAIQAHYAKLTTHERQASTILYIAANTHRRYASLSVPTSATDTNPTYQLQEVDQLSPRLQDPTDPTLRTISTQLHITPALQELYYPYALTAAGTPFDPRTLTLPTTAADLLKATILPILTVSTTTATATPYSIDHAIHDTDTDDTTTTNNTNTTDHLEIAIYHPTTTYTPAGGQPRPVAYSIPYTTHPVTQLPYHIPLTNLPAYPAGPFQLSTPTTPNTIAHLLANSPTIDTRLEHHIPIQLPTGIAPDPTHPYLICGRLYACHKLEITLTPTGPNPLIQGHFYEIQQP